MVWTNVSKPGAQSWVGVNPQSKTAYDELTVQYDDSLIFYDGGNPNAWTGVAKPGAQSWISIAKPS